MSRVAATTATANSTNTSPPPPPPSDGRGCYRCIHCFHAVPALVRWRGSDLQLRPCDACGALDPYLEREFLLVAMDLFLLRLAAVRHVLCNRWRPYGKGADKHDEGRPDLQTETPPAVRSLVLLVILVRTHLAQIATPERRPVHLDILLLTRGWIHGLFVSALGLLVPLLLCLWFLGRHSTATTRIDGGAGLVSTALVYVATDVIHVWENSDTVRQMGAVFLLIHQYFVLLTMLQIWRDRPDDDDETGRSAAHHNVRRIVPPGALALCLGLMLLLLRGMVMQLYWTYMVGHDVPTPLPCPGFYWTFLERSSWRICLV